jgi:hypothetical protein
MENQENRISLNLSMKKGVRPAPLEFDHEQGESSLKILIYPPSRGTREESCIKQDSCRLLQRYPSQIDNERVQGFVPILFLDVE